MLQWLTSGVAVTALLAGFAWTQAPAARSLAITSVNVIDVSARTPATALLTDRTVVITGNRITAIGDARRIAVPARAQRLDGRGKYLMPGMWDMHAHALDEHEWAFPLFVANGVTGIREMGTILPYERINEIRQGVADGTIVGPRIGAATARVLDGVGGRGGPVTPVAGGDEGRRLVREYKQNGIDFIKPYNLLARDAYLAIIDEARRQGLPVSGHVPLSMSAAEASDVGQIGIEHMWDVLLSSSRDETTLRQERLALAKSATVGVFPQIESKAAATYDERRASALFDRFVNNRTAVIPTMVVFEVMLKSTGDLASDERLKYVPQPTRERWQKQVAQRPDGLAQVQAPMQQKRLEIIKSMHEHGVQLLTGTDLLNPYLFPGFSLHDELDWLTKAGLPPFDVLRIATINATRFLGRENDLGSIREGQVADGILLDANPLQDVRNARRIAAVIADGRVHDRASLDAMLAKVH